MCGVRDTRRRENRERGGSRLLRAPRVDPAPCSRHTHTLDRDRRWWVDGSVHSAFHPRLPGGLDLPDMPSLSPLPRDLLGPAGRA